MKRSDKIWHTSVTATVLLWLVPALLIIPNVILDITEPHYSICDRAINILLPAGVYLVAMALWKRVGWPALCLFPIMILCAFQIVLLFLYGESIIAIDMFLNVATTNVGEVTELLRNLSIAIIVVCIIYLPPVVLAIVTLVHRMETAKSARRAALFAGTGLLAVGAVMVAVGASTVGFRPQRTLFPVNVISNLVMACERTEASARYMETSEDYRFYARSTRPADSPEIYVLVIGETSRADNWQLGCYDRCTNPRLAARQGVVFFDYALSESNTTHKSVPLLMSPFGCEAFGDSIYQTRGVIDAFSEAGYSTAWFSNQRRNGQLIDAFGSRADTAVFITDDGNPHFDSELCAILQQKIEESVGKKLFVVLHTYGSHFNYKERYPENFNVFGPDISAEAEPENRPGLINAYDNTICYTDYVLDSFMSVLEAAGAPAALVYLADHGEDIYDDNRHRFLHASPTPTYWQLHVPFVVWMSQSYRDAYPEKYAAASVNSSKNVSSSRSAFHTLMSLAGISTPVYKPADALTEPDFTSPRRLYLNDYNEGVPLESSGLRSPDFAQLASHGIR